MSTKETCVVKPKFICSYINCNKSFGRQSRFLIHLRTHTGEKPFVCSSKDCGKAYARAQHLKRHVEISHSDKKQIQEYPQHKYQCSLSDCEKNFVSECNLKRHIKTVHGRQFKYRCTVEGCKKKFCYENQLKRHEALHSDSNPFVCTIPGCTYSCKIGHQLKRHFKTHEGYECKEEGCKIKLETWSLLRKHRMIHHPKEYECSECQLKFKKKIQLKRHILVHSSDEKLYKCDQEGCERVYLDLRNLRAHIKSYHDGHRLPCTFQGCNQTFVNKAKLKQHSRLHDPDKPPPKKMPKKGHRKKAATEHLTRLICGSNAQIPFSDGSCSESDKIVLTNTSVSIRSGKQSVKPSSTIVTSLGSKTETSKAISMVAVAVDQSLTKSFYAVSPLSVCKDINQSKKNLDSSKNDESASISLDVFTKNVDTITCSLSSESMTSNQLSHSLNTSANSGLDNSTISADTLFYEKKSEKNILTLDPPIDAVDLWLESMAAETLPEEEAMSR